MPSSAPQKIVALREARQMTQEALAQELQVSRTLIAAWESGRSKPNDSQLSQLAQFFQVNYRSLRPSGADLPERYGQVHELAHAVIEKGKNVCDDLSNDLRRGAFNPIVQEVMDISRRDQKPHETYHWSHPLDSAAHKRFLGLIHEVILPFFPDGLIVFSEESIDEKTGMTPIVLPEGAPGNSAMIQDYAIIDPLDRTAEAIRGIAGFSNITIGSLTHGPLVSVVFCLFDQYVSCYYAIAGQGAWVKFRNGSSQPIFPSGTKNLEGACLAAYVGRPSRLTGFTVYADLLEHHGVESPFVNASGCYGFCLVASSQVDAFIEVTKGYAWHDIVAGEHILREAGGVIKDLDFRDLPDPLSTGVSSPSAPTVEKQASQLAKTWSATAAVQSESEPGDFQVRRYPFIASATYDLGAQIAIDIAKSKARN
jgi:fructose-1,6-bisphosphatase/inositol monophosphatase family enzyme/transcriptional regulator with XRE-family HTH domain